MGRWFAQASCTAIDLWLLAGLKWGSRRDLPETEFDVDVDRIGSFRPERSMRNRLLELDGWAQRRPEPRSAVLPACFVFLSFSSAMPCAIECRAVFPFLPQCQRRRRKPTECEEEVSQSSHVLSFGRASLWSHTRMAGAGRRGKPETFSHFFSHARHCQSKKSYAARLLA